MFYNGTEEQPEQYDLKLSDAFIHPVEHPELELTCRVYNINKGRNKKLLDGCPVLKEYMIFVDYVRGYHAKQDYENLPEEKGLKKDEKKKYSFLSRRGIICLSVVHRS